MSLFLHSEYGCFCHQMSVADTRLSKYSGDMLVDSFDTVENKFLEKIQSYDVSRDHTVCAAIDGTFLLIRFPRPGHDKRDAWINFVQRNRREEAWLPTEHTLICSDHFKDEHKYYTKTGRLYLKKCAVPYDSMLETPNMEVPMSGPVSYSESIIDSHTGELYHNIRSVQYDATLETPNMVEPISEPVSYPEAIFEPPTGRLHHKKGAVPYDSTLETSNITTEPMVIISEQVSDSESILDSPTNRLHLKKGSDGRMVIISEPVNTSESTFDPPTRRLRLKKSAVPQDSTLRTSNMVKFKEPMVTKSEPVNSESTFVAPQKIVLDNKSSKELTGQNLFADKIKRQNRSFKKKCVSYKLIVMDIKNKFGFDPQQENDLMHKAVFVDLHKSFIKKNKQNKHSLLYTAPLRKFALSLHYYSPTAYKYVRGTYDKVLPHPKTICKWYSTVDAEPGFTEEAFKVLKNKRQLNKKPVICSLVFDEIAIRSKKLFNRERKLGAVNFGAGPLEGEDEETTATQALVFMLVSLNENWKLPVGYFLISKVNPKQKANLIKICLEKCHEVGVVVANVTFDGGSENLSAAEMLGCQLTHVHNLKTHFPHPSTSEKVCIFIDPCHVVKLIRHTFEHKRLLLDGNNEQIKWQLLINLNKLQKNKSLQFDNKLSLSPRHIYFRNQIMKIKLATQLLSMSLVRALNLCDEILNSSNFKDSTATVNFITVMNKFLDVFNSKYIHLLGLKRPIDKRNKFEIFAVLDEVKSYILQLEYLMKTKMTLKRKNRPPKTVLNTEKIKIVESSHITRFIGIIICIESMKTLYNNLVQDKKLLNSIAMNRISQGHLDLFFGLIRKHGGYNNNPDVLQFRAAYKKTLNHLELRSSFTENCIPLDNFSISNPSSVNIINSTSSLNRHEEETYEVLQSTRPLESDVEVKNNCEILANMLNHENSIPASHIVGYISGYIARCLTNSLKCEECVDALVTTSKLSHHNLITLEDMGGLCYSSDDVYKICLSTETIIRRLIKKSGGKLLSSKYNYTNIRANTLKLFIEKDVFTCITQHAFDQPSTLNHKIHLIRAIIHEYTTIRLCHDAKVTSVMSKHQKLDKLILL